MAADGGEESTGAVECAVRWASKHEGVEEQEGGRSQLVWSGAGPTSAGETEKRGGISGTWRVAVALRALALFHFQPFDAHSIFSALRVDVRSPLPPTHFFLALTPDFLFPTRHRPATPTVARHRVCISIAAVSLTFISPWKAHSQSMRRLTRP